MTSMNGGAHPLAMDAHSGNARGSDADALDPSACEYARTLPTHSRTRLLPKKIKRFLPRMFLQLIKVYSYPFQDLNNHQLFF